MEVCHRSNLFRAGFFWSEIRCGTIFHNLMLNLGTLVTFRHILACYHGSGQIGEIVDESFRSGQVVFESSVRVSLASGMVQYFITLCRI